MLDRPIPEFNNQGGQSKSTSKIRLMVVDDHEVVRKGLALVLNLEEDIEVCCEAGSGADAVRQAQKLNPDLVLMDLNMPGMNGLEAARAIKAQLPRCKILILTGVDVDAAIFEALQTEIDGYILKQVTPDELVRAVRNVAAGEAYLHPTVTRKVLEKFRTTAHPPLAAQNLAAPPAINPDKVVMDSTPRSSLEPFGESLSEREREVLRGVALGQSNREIGESLFLSEETVRTHLKNIFRKLGVSDRTQAVVMALKSGILEI